MSGLTHYLLRVARRVNHHYYKYRTEKLNPNMGRKKEKTHTGVMWIGACPCIFYLNNLTLASAAPIPYASVEYNRPPTEWQPNYGATYRIYGHLPNGNRTMAPSTEYRKKRYAT